ncbi:MAG TPA: EAL domain-containing protein [Candidatus Baltobacteraceae bacterium]|jgi:diguanylate cyclase (GGDEF)-like protein|nr:EAL domain-containing protein [Candidatus Baltobacteraceae bacterium]
MYPIGALSSGAGSVTELERLFEITRDVLGAPSLDAALTSLARGIQELFGWRFVTMVAAEEPNGELRRRVLLGYPQDVIEQRLYERIDHQAFEEMLSQAVRFFEDCYFFPAEREAHWERSIYTGEMPNAPQRKYPSQWHERDALVLTLHDRDGLMIGYMSPDGPISGEIPSAQTLRAMQVFVNLMGMALATARSQSRLQYEATHDSLTGLPNRTVFSLELARALEAVQRGDALQRAVLYLDLDEFKSINDTLGHIAGDDVLKEAATRLRAVMDERFTVARMAGDEFAVLVADATPERIGSALDVIHRTLRRPYHVAGREIVMTASIGVAPVDKQYTSIAEVLRDADTAMYYAKSEGRNRSAYFVSSMHEEALRRLSLRMHLRSAIEEKQFVVLYQPIVELATGAISGFEALLRWNHPEQGYLSPASFLPLAEEMGLMVPVGRFVLSSACYQLRRWRELTGDQNLKINVNLSVQEVLQPDLPEFLAALVEEFAIRPGQLSLEITETSILQSELRAAGVLAQLKAVGVELCIDDFGTGYSSLRYIKSLPIDAFKIDQTFISDLDDVKSQQIVEMLVGLGQACKLRVTAEGIETPMQAQRLLALGCVYGQGLYFHAAMPAEMVAPLLSLAS